MDDIEFSQTNPNIIYVSGTHYLVYKSTDGGDTFTQIANLREYIDTH